MERLDPSRAPGQSAVDWQGGVPVSRRFDDPYYSLADGPAETAHVFLAGNDLPGRFRAGFRIAELGFGTGLNALIAWAAWEAAGHRGPLSFTSFEAYPLPPADLARALDAFPAFADRAARLAAAYADRRAGRVIDLGTLHLTLVEGDAADTLPRWTGRADAWFLDGFAPAKNPALWTDALMAEVGRHTAPGGTATSYTAAGHVRRALAAAGFDVIRTPGFGAKRHMTRARLP